MIDLFFEYGLPIIYIVAKILLITLPLLLCVAYLTYAEKKSNWSDANEKRAKCCRSFWPSAANS